MVNNVNEGIFMRLYNIYYICKDSREITGDLKAEEFKRGGVGAYRLLNWPEFKETLDVLFNIACLHEVTEDVFSAIPLIVRSWELPEISVSEFSELNKNLCSLNLKLDAIIELYESMNLEETKIGLEVKIPQSDSLSEYIDILHDLDFVFEQCPYCRINDEQLKFTGTDIGSAWLTFALVSEGTYRLLNNVGKLIDKAIVIKSHFLTLKMQEEELEAMRAKNTVSKETIEVFQQMKKLTYKKYVDELAEEIEPTADGEEEGKVEKSLEKLANLIDKGVEIYTSIETPKEVKAVFPVSDKQEALPDGLIKYLEDKHSTEINETE